MSNIFEGFLSTPEAQELFSERRFVAAMLRFEASLARAQSSVGLIPEAAAHSIIGTCKVELFDVGKIVRESAGSALGTGSIASPLVDSLKETVGLFNQEAARFVHFGSSTQDLIDTALVLLTRDALGVIELDVHKAVNVLVVLAGRHADAPVLARTLMQPASVTSFGLKCALWAAPLVRSLQRLQSARANALSVQLGGAVGTLAQMRGKGAQIMACMAADLKLKASPCAWHTQRDEWVALGCEIALLVGSLGKIARDISLMSQHELGELAEPRDTARNAASAVSHEHQPASSRACMRALTAAQRVPQRVAALLAAMPQEHERALGNWQAELAEWPGLVMSAHDATRAMAQLLSGLQVDTQRMRSNLDAVRDEVSREVADEWFDPALARHAAALTRTQVTLHRNALAALNPRDEPLAFRS